MIDPETQSDRLRLLADVLLVCRWTLEEHQSLRIGFTKHNPQGAKALLNALHEAFPFVPSRTQLLKYLSANPGVLKGLRWKRLPDIQLVRRLSLTRMHPAVGRCQSFPVPELPTLGSVAEQLFNLPHSVLEWLEQPAAKHYHYVVQTIAKRGPDARRAPRILEQPKRLLKAAQRDILREILQWVPTHPAAHGFVRGRSVVSFTREHIGQAAVLRMDLDNFFPSITAARVSAIFRSLGYPMQVARVLTNLCTTSSHLELLPEFNSLRSEQQSSLRSLYSRAHLPQGAPTSPTLANLVAYRLDARLTGLARRAGCSYSRYADDLLFSGDRRWQRQADSFKCQVSAIVLDEGFSVNYRKTRLMPRSIQQTATGIVLNQHCNVDRRQYDNLKAILTNCIRFGTASQNRESHDDFRAHLFGRIGWVQQLNATRGKKLMQLFNRIVW